MTVMLVSRLYWVVGVLYLVTSVTMCPHSDPTLSRWSDINTWPDKKLPESGSNVSITGNVLLDMSPPPLFGITIETNARLVWSPNGNFTVITNFIHVKGGFHIGSETCPFEANARISLTGDRKTYSVPKFDQKFIGVENGATLEIHGKKKLSWTKLIQTVPRLQRTNGLVFSSSADLPIGQYQKGLGIYTFNPDGGVYSYKVYSTTDVSNADLTWTVQKIVSHLSGIPDGKIVLMGVQSSMISDTPQIDLSPVFDAMEATAGIPQGQGQIRQIRRFDAYALATIKGDPTKTMETLSPVHHLHQTAEASVDINELKMVAISKTTSKDIDMWANFKVEFMVVNKAASTTVLDLLDDVSSWQEGDRLLLTSTDYDMEKAEETTMVGCPECSTNQAKVAFIPKFMHYGEVKNNVDMRGEVALLSRNILIEGVMNGYCPSVNENCEDYAYDTFGGHVKVVKGFKNVHIEGAEFYHLGKQTDLGHYPIHFHMCDDVDDLSYPNPPYVRDNSIHYTFGRCITVHGTHGLKVMDNVGYESLGHCYFLEDGGERRTVFDGNLGASTREGLLIPSDSKPTTFWITNPNTVLRNNIAAGSKKKGYWFIYPDLPLGLSATKGFMQREEARSTAITEFTNNVAHSNQNGLFLDERLDENTGDIVPNNNYHPRVDPLDKNSEDKHVILDRLTAYHNDRNAWIRGGWITLSRASFAGSLTSLILVGSWNLKQFLSKSVVLGETDNIGDPEWGYGADGWRLLPRSVPQKYDYNLPIQGVAFYDGPTYVFDTFFGNFTTDQYRKAGALGFKRNNKFFTPPTSGTKNIKFGFHDGILTGNRVYDGNSSVHGFDDFDGDVAAKFVDMDGTVTSTSQSTVVRFDPYMVTSDCAFRDSWNLAICPHRYIEMRVFIKSSQHSALKPFVSRDDIPEHPRRLSLNEPLNSFSMIANGQHSYSVHWPNGSPSEYLITTVGMERAFPMRIGFCLPRNATFNLMTWYPKVAWGTVFWTEVNSIQEIDNDTEGAKYFYNRNTGMLYVKLMTLEDREDKNFYDCLGDNCPNIWIHITGGDLGDADCSQRHIPTPPSQLNVDENKLMNFMDNVFSAPDPDWGAGHTLPFIKRQRDGKYGEWSEWSECSKNCGGGNSFRTRACDSPIPRNGQTARNIGDDCAVPTLETEICNIHLCHADQEGLGVFNGES